MKMKELLPACLAWIECLKMAYSEKARCDSRQYRRWLGSVLPHDR